MNIEDIREHAIAKPDVTEGFPFGEQTLVFKVKEKIFLLMSLDADPLQFKTHIFDFLNKFGVLVPIGVGGKKSRLVC